MDLSCNEVRHIRAIVKEKRLFMAVYGLKAEYDYQVMPGFDKHQSDYI